MVTDQIRLTEYSRGSGCGCKISPSVLREILKSEDVLPRQTDLLVGNDTNDDAAVLQWTGDQCLISTTDFFMPVVNDAYDFGRIAATNALSDVYAMGGRPILALAILGWPVDKLPTDLARQVMEGARFICHMAGISLAGGHSVDSVEPFFGLALNGAVHKANLKRNNTANVGDSLFITKPLGMGIITTAHKRGVVSAEHYDIALSYMCTLNKMGEALGGVPSISALTDVTGFGLAGHLIEMCDDGRLSAQLNYNAIQLVPGIDTYTSQMIYPDMTMKNFSTYGPLCSEMSMQQIFTLCDPQTSGGLLIAVKEEGEQEYLDLVQQFGLQGIADKCIGKFIEPTAKRILL